MPAGATPPKVPAPGAIPTDVLLEQQMSASNGFLLPYRTLTLNNCNIHSNTNGPILSANRKKRCRFFGISGYRQTGEWQPLLWTFNPQLFYLVLQSLTRNPQPFGRLYHIAPTIRHGPANQPFFHLSQYLTQRLSRLPLHIAN